MCVLLCWLLKLIMLTRTTKHFIIFCFLCESGWIVSWCCDWVRAHSCTFISGWCNKGFTWIACYQICCHCNPCRYLIWLVFSYSWHQVWGFTKLQGAVYVITIWLRDNFSVIKWCQHLAYIKKRKPKDPNLG